MKKIIFGLGIAALIAGCYPKGPQYVSDFDLVATDYDDTLNFGAQNQFFVFDTVVHISSSAGQDNISTQYDDLIVSTVEDQMAQRGYEQVNSAAQADLVLNITAWSTTSTNYYYDWYNYWGWGYPGYGPGWGWYYPSGGYAFVQSYTFGTVIIDMNYPAGANLENKTIPIVWTGLINGLLDGSTPSINTRITDSIDQAFTQSPYILRN